MDYLFYGWLVLGVVNLLIMLLVDEKMTWGEWVGIPIFGFIASPLMFIFLIADGIENKKITKEGVKWRF